PRLSPPVAPGERACPRLALDSAPGRRGSADRPVLMRSGWYAICKQSMMPSPSPSIGAMSSNRPNPLFTLPAALLAVALTGRPGVTENPYPAPQGPVGKVKLVQTVLAADDPQIHGFYNFFLSPSGERLYATSWLGGLMTFDRSAEDGSLTRAYIANL